MINKLDVGTHDPDTDSIVIEGVKYAGSLFRFLGYGMLAASIGDIIRIDLRKDEAITLIKMGNDFPGIPNRNIFS